MNVANPSSSARLVVPPDYRLRLPGPATVPGRVRAALAQPVVSHRGPEFRAILAEALEMLQVVLGTKREILLLGASGTGGMEAALANILAPGDALLVVTCGQFGERFAQIAEIMGANVDRVDANWGEAPDLSAIADRMKTKTYRAVVCVHNESSTGVVTDIATIGTMLRDTPTLLVVDSVSGIGGIEMRMDDWGIDLLVAASQKALMCPPGLAFIAVSDKGAQIMETANGVPRFYFDLRRAKAALQKDETAFTPPVSLIFALHEALTMIQEEGLPSVLARHRRLSEALQAGCVALGLPMFPTARPLSATVTVARVPEGLDGATIVRHMHSRYRTVIAGQRTKLSGRVIRIGTMGAIGTDDILTDLRHLEETLRDLGRSVPTGAGVQAAISALAG